MGFFFFLIGFFRINLSCGSRIPTTEEHTLKYSKQGHPARADLSKEIQGEQKETRRGLVIPSVTR